MSKESERRLQEFIDGQMSIDYRDEEVQKKIVISQDHGASITLYDYIHGNDIPMSDIEILDVGGMSDDWIDKFRKMFMENLNK
jgi:hypothetical protein